MAEIELSVFSRQCLNRRIPDRATLTRELAALVRRRNEAHATYRLAIYHLGCTDHFASSLSYTAKSSGLTTSLNRVIATVLSVPAMVVVVLLLLAEVNTGKF